MMSRHRTDGGKTLKIMMISAPNKGHIIDRDTQISASVIMSMSRGGLTKQGPSCRYSEQVTMVVIRLQEQYCRTGNLLFFVILLLNSRNAALSRCVTTLVMSQTK